MFFYKQFNSEKKGCGALSSGCTSIVLIVIGIVLLLISTETAKSIRQSLYDLRIAKSLTQATSGIVKGTGWLKANKPVQAPYGNYCALYNLKGSICYTEKSGTADDDTTVTIYNKPKMGEGLVLETSNNTININKNTNIKVFGNTQDQGDLEKTDEIPPLYPYDFIVAMNNYRSGLIRENVFRYFSIDITSIENGANVFVLGRLENNQLKEIDDKRPMIIALKEEDYKKYLDEQQFISKIFFWLGLFVLLIGIGWLTTMLLITLALAAGGVWILQQISNWLRKNN